MIGYFMIGAVIGYILIILFEVFWVNNINKLLIIRGQHLHHSLFALIPLVLIPFNILSIFLLLGLSIGIVVRHTYDEKKFIFIEKA